MIIKEELKMAYGTSRYNPYRKRSFTRSDKQRREYAQAMDDLEQAFEKLDGWYLSSMKDSAYKSFEKYEVRLSNHSADNQYHNLENGRLIVNVKASKLNFVDIIENKLDKIIEKIDSLDLDKYRFINATNMEHDIKCYYKGFKTKKDVI
nr:MAG TPA_asm: hypothetical protein [Caudoviricetes sp.]